MRIAVGSHFYVPNRMAGSETALHAALLALLEAGHQITVFCTESGGGYTHEGVRVVESSAGSLRGNLHDYKPHVVLGQHSQWATVAQYAGHERIPSVLYAHNDHQATKLMLHRSPTLVAYNTEHVRETFSRHGLPNVVLHPPVKPEEHRTTPGDMITMVNPSKNKGHATFYRVAASMPDIPFLAVEGGHGTQVFEAWPNVEVQPQTANMREDVWSRTRLLLVPSEYESYGMVGVEALASGIPVLAHPAAGLLESLGEGGIFLDRNDPQLWVNKIKELSDGRRWNRASRRAKQRSVDIEKQRPIELARWVEAVELAHEAGRDGFREAWKWRSQR